MALVLNADLSGAKEKEAGLERDSSVARPRNDGLYKLSKVTIFMKGDSLKPLCMIGFLVVFRMSDF